MDEPARGRPIVGVVGPCGAGKSTLVAGLERAGFACRHIAQEHSYVPYMWQRIAKPDFLIYLAASFEQCTRRRSLNWQLEDYAEQLRRLAHAREHAHLVIDTDLLSSGEVLARVLVYLNRDA